MILQSTEEYRERKYLTQDGSKAEFIRKQKNSSKKNPEKNLNASWFKYFLCILAVVHCRGSGPEVLLVKYSLSTLKKRHKSKNTLYASPKPAYSSSVLKQTLRMLFASMDMSLVVEGTGIRKCPVPNGPVPLRHLHNHFHQGRYNHSIAQKRSKNQRLLP